MSEHKQEQPGLSVNDTFHFRCGPDVPCFTQCCRNVTIFLNPYDIIRMKNRLGMHSSEFLDKYTLALKKENTPMPLVVLKMGDDKEQKCQLVNDEGCSVYEDRPWSCRMYPLDQTGPISFRYIAEPSLCKGLEDENTYKVSDYLVDQGILIYKEMEQLFEQLTNHEHMGDIDADSDKVAQMLYMALYDLDRFRDFVFQSKFLDTFDVDEQTIENIKRSDVELMKFAFSWVRYGLFGDPFFELKESVAQSNNTEAGEKA